MERRRVGDLYNREIFVVKVFGFFFRKTDNSFIQSVFSIFNQDLAVSLLSFFSNVIFARWLGPVQLGLFYVIGLISSYSEKFGRLGGIDIAALYFLKKKKHAPAEIAGHLLIVSFVLASVPIVGFYFFRHAFYETFIKTDVVPGYYVWTIVATIPFIFICVAYNKILFGLHQIREYAFLQVTKSLIIIGLSLFFWWRRWDVFGLCLSMLISWIVVAMATIQVANTGRLEFKLKKTILMDLLGYGWRPYLITLITFLHQRADLLLVSFFLPPADVAFYSLAVTGSQIVWKIPHSVSSLLFARVASEDAQQATLLTGEAVRMVLLSTAVVSFIGLLLIYPVVTLIYGTKYTPIIKPFVFLLPGTVLMCVSKLLTDHFYGLAKPNYALFSNSVCGPLNIGLNVWFLPQYGIAAAALISSLTYSLQALLLSLAYKKEGGLILDLILVRSSDVNRVRNFLTMKRSIS